MAMKFARVMCGSKEARVGGSISPSKFLDLKSSLSTFRKGGRSRFAVHLADKLL